MQASVWFRCLTAVLPLMLVLALPAEAGYAEDAVPPVEEEDEAPLEGEAKKKHAKEVKAILKSLTKEKNKQVVVRRIQGLGAKGTRAGRDALMKFVKGNKNHAHVAEAFTALRKIGDKKSIEFLCGKLALRNKNFLIAQTAANELAEAKDPRAVAPLLEVMTGKGTKIEIVGACAKAVAQSAPEDERVVEVLFKYSHHKKDTIRSYTLEALGYLGTDEAIARLKDALEKDKNTRARGAAATGMGHSKRQECIPYLKAALGRDKSMTVKDAVYEAMKKIEGG